MAALTKATNVSKRHVTRDKRPLAAGVRAWQGGIAAMKATGFVGPATGAATEVVIGYFYESVDNSAGADGAKFADVHHVRGRTLLLFANAGTGTVPVTSRERKVYVTDDQTVSTTAANGIAGVCYDVTTEGVWVEFVPFIA
jgi:hypothetical protein